MIILTRKELLKLFDYNPETGVILHKTGQMAGQVAGSINAYGFTCIGKHGQQLYAHRIAAQIITSKDISECHVCHRNGIRTDNRACNLVIVPKQKKNLLRKKDRRRTLKYRGIVRYQLSSGTYYQAKIQVQGRTFRGEYRKTQKAAFDDYCRLFVKNHGFALCPPEVYNNYVKLDI